ncbi:MAG: AraC family transcriptional regulator, partial [Bacteroidaceae bacterium]
MREIYFDSVQRFNEFYGFETLHPLVSVVRYDKLHEVEELCVRYGLYAIFLKENKGCEISYGRTKYDFDEMTVTTFAPGQTIHVKPMKGVKYPKWTALVFHPDLPARTSLGRNIGKYDFFSYSSNEALHLSLGEIEIFRGVLDMISQELCRSIDKHSRSLIVSNIELLLNYCLRFYDRQFVTREE